jgi:hypothetical protein
MHERRSAKIDFINFKCFMDPMRNVELRDEASCISWLDQLAKRYSYKYGMEPMEVDDASEYQYLRRCMGVTAGYQRHIDPFFRGIGKSFSAESKQIASELYSKGWAILDHDIFSYIEPNMHREIDSIVNLDVCDTKRSFKIPIQFGGILKTAITATVRDAISIYLGTDRPFFYQPHILHSQPTQLSKATDKELSDHAFAFHRDIDNLKWIKLFVCLSTNDGGNHEYISGSHYTLSRAVCNGFHHRSMLCRFETQFEALSIYETHLHMGRFSEKSLRLLYNKQEFVSFPSRKGMCWIEDTYGLHRGNPAQDTNRLVASFEIGQFPIRYC